MIDIKEKIKSPEDYGAKLHINEKVLLDTIKPVVFDVETDEQDNFVGLAMAQTDKDIYYYDKEVWYPEVVDFLGNLVFIMQGGKFDIRMLKKWGVQTDYNALVHDTKILSYCMDSSLDSYSLKSLAKKYLGIEYPTYKEMVGSGKKKTTLDKQPVERVAAYCGMDVLSTLRLKDYCLKRMNEKQIEYYNKIEMPLYRLLSRMEDKGVYIDVEYLKSLDLNLKSDLKYWEDETQKYLKDNVNLNSPKQILEVLKTLKIPVRGTSVKDLAPYKDQPFVKELLTYRKYKKLKSTYTEPFLQGSTLPLIHGNFTQNTLTGRLASSHPNLQNIPAPDPKHNRFHDDVGTKIRKAFVAPPHSKLLVLDYSQIEYRLFAHYTQEPVLLEAYKNGEDIHQKTADLIGFPDNRRLGKTINFAAIYGAGSKRIAETAGISEDRATKALDSYWTKLPKAAAWITLTKWRAAKYGTVETILGRTIPIQGIKSKNKFERWHAERVAVNAVIQGSAADIIKKAMLNIDGEGYDVRLQVHDELMLFVFDTDNDSLKKVKDLMINAVQLSVPIEVDGGYGQFWTEAKQ